MRISLFLAVSMSGLLAGHADATVINVPSAQPTIQAGVDVALPGDTVLVAGGVYTGPGNRDIDFNGNDIVVLSAAGPQATIIDCQGSEIEPHRGFMFHSGETGAARVEGFTIRNGHAHFGGAILCSDGSNPTIAHNLIINNQDPDGGGGGICCNSADPVLTDNVFSGNVADDGGAISLINSNATISYNVMAGNSTPNEGGALSLWASSPLLEANTIVRNTSGYGGGGMFLYNSSPTLTNCVVAFNRGVGGILCSVSGTDNEPELSCCNIFGNEIGDWIGCIADQADSNGNISLDPLFCDTASGDYSLDASSPCLPANNGCGTLIGALGQGCGSVVWYVATDGDDLTGDGSQENPFATIQHAIDTASEGDKVFVAAGTYTGEGNRDIDFGGKTILLASLDGRESTVIDCQADTLDQHRGFIFDSGETPECVVDGFTIRNGYAPWLIEDSHVYWYGGGIYVDNSSPTIRNCIVDSCFASSSGGGMYCDTNSAPLVEFCEFRHNTSWIGSGMGLRNSAATIQSCTFRENSIMYPLVWPNGGGLSIHGPMAPTLTACLIEQNWAGLGGGLFISNCSPVLSDCTIQRNSAQFAAGIDLFNSSAVFDHCLIVRNNPSMAVGGFESFSSNLTFNFCTIARNTGGDRGSSGFSINQTDVDFTNCLIAFNGGWDTALYSDSLSTATLACCDVYGNSGGDWIGALAGQGSINGNLSADPLFCSDDFHLMDISLCAPSNNICGVQIGALGVGCNGPKAIIEPGTMYYLYKWALEPLVATIHFGNLNDGHTVADVNPSTVRIDYSTFEPDTWSIEPSHPDFDGPVVKLTCSVSEFLEFYEPFFDSSVQRFSVFGRYDNDSLFGARGYVTLRGHVSGDANGDGEVNVADISYLVSYLFQGGPVPSPAADVDCSGPVNVADLSYLVMYLLQQGPAPPPCR